jgi:hypothetical protein
MNRFTAAVAPALVVAATASTLLMAPAEAATSRGGCTVAPVRPAATNQVDANGVRIVDYAVRVLCNGGRSVEVQQFRLEEDTLPRDIDAIDEITGNTLRTLDFTGGPGLRTAHVRESLPNTPGDGAVEEVYHKVRFRVTTPAGTTAWTPFELSAVRAIHS